MFFVSVLLVCSSFAQLTPCNNLTLSNPGSGFGISRVYFDGRMPVGPAVYSNTTPIEEGFTKEYDSAGVGLISLYACKEYYIRLSISGIASVWTWIDYNQDGIFNNTDEEVTAGASGFFSSTDAISFYGDDVGKTYYMRIAAKQGLGQLMHPCDTALLKGDVEDYKITILPPDTLPVPFDTTGICAFKNLVINPGFEDLCCCPTSISLYEHITNNHFASNYATTDIYNNCALYNSIDVPTNGNGFQYPHTGEGYAGIIAWQKGQDYSEYVQMKLKTPLTAFQQYYYEFHINLANRSKYALNKFGLLFDNDTVYENHFHDLNATPQVVITNASFYTDTLGWMKIAGYYTPTISGEEYVVFGNFDDTANVVTQSTGFGTDEWVYYYVDDFLIIPEPSFLLPAYSATICYGDSINLNTYGTCFMNWVSLLDTSDTLSTGNDVWAYGDTIATIQYVVSGNDGGSLWIKDTFNITVMPYPIANAGLDDTICEGQQVILSASGGGTYLWSTGATTHNTVQQPNINTLYTVTVTNGYCADFDSVFVNINPVPLPGINITNILCNGQSTGAAIASVSGTLTYAYSWSTGNTSSQITGLSAGIYTVTVTDSNGCSSDSVITIIEPSLLSVISSPNVYICNGQNVILTSSVSGGTGSYSYSWQPGGDTTSSLQVATSSSTQFTIIVTDDNGCIASSTTTVSPGPLLTATISSSAVICEGENIQLTSAVLSGVGGYSYNWFPGASTTNTISVSPTSSTMYYLTISDTCNTRVDSVWVTVNNRVQLLSSPDDSICLGNEIIMFVSGADTYTWVPSVISLTMLGDTVKASPTTSTVFTVTGTAANGCTTTEMINIFVTPIPIVDAGNNVTIIQGQSTILTAIGGANYVWSPTKGLSCDTCRSPIAAPNTSTRYYLLVTDSNGCVNIDSVFIEVKVLCGDIFLPSAFSPNSDGENDVLSVYTNGNYNKFYLVVYDRWGEKVFESNDKQSSWDGSYNGKEIDTAVFMYILTYTCEEQEIVKKGNISLIR